MNQEHTYKHVLVALDINDDFQPLLQRAITIARRHNAKLWRFSLYVLVSEL